MNRILAAILLTGAGFLIIQLGLLEELDGPIDWGSFVLGMGLTVSAGFLFIVFRTWDGHRCAFFQAPRPGAPSAFNLFWNATVSFVYVTAMVLLIIFVVLEFYGQHG
jgi:hypothetical protein